MPTSESRPDGGEARSLRENTDIVGLIPAAGHGSRLAPLPCSKEVYPVGFRSADGRGTRPKVAAHYLLEKLAGAGARRTFVVIREGKWDIPAYFGTGHLVGLSLAYVVMQRSLGVPFTVDAAYPFIAGRSVIFGFPDILFEPKDGFISLLTKRRETGAELVLGVFPSRRPDKEDLLELDSEGRIIRYEVKPNGPSARHTWLFAVWGPGFTRFLHEFVADVLPEVEADGLWRGRELLIGDVVWAAVQGGLDVQTVLFPEGSYIDIGTPKDLALALRKFGTDPLPAAGGQPGRRATGA